MYILAVQRRWWNRCGSYCCCCWCCCLMMMRVMVALVDEVDATGWSNYLFGDADRLSLCARLCSCTCVDVMQFAVISIEDRQQLWHIWVPPSAAPLPSCHPPLSFDAQAHYQVHSVITLHYKLTRPILNETHDLDTTYVRTQTDRTDWYIGVHVFHSPEDSAHAKYPNVNRGCGLHPLNVEARDRTRLLLLLDEIAEYQAFARRNVRNEALHSVQPNSTTVRCVCSSKSTAHIFIFCAG